MADGVVPTRSVLDLSPADLELVAHRALEARDFEAVVAVLKLMATKDPRRAEGLLNLLQVGIELSRAERVAAEGRDEVAHPSASDPKRADRD